MPSQPLRSSTASEPVRAVSEIVGIGWIASARVVAGQIRGRSRRILEVTYDGCAVAAIANAACHDASPRSLRKTCGKTVPGLSHILRDAYGVSH